MGNWNKWADDLDRNLAHGRGQEPQPQPKTDTELVADAVDSSPPPTDWSKVLKSTMADAFAAGLKGLAFYRDSIQKRLPASPEVYEQGQYAYPPELPKTVPVFVLDSCPDDTPIIRHVCVPKAVLDKMDASMRAVLAKEKRQRDQGKEQTAFLSREVLEAAQLPKDCPMTPVESPPATAPGHLEPLRDQYGAGVFHRSRLYCEWYMGKLVGEMSTKLAERHWPGSRMPKVKIEPPLYYHLCPIADSPKTPTPKFTQDVLACSEIRDWEGLVASPGQVAHGAAEVAPAKEFPPPLGRDPLRRLVNAGAISCTVEVRRVHAAGAGVCVFEGVGDLIHAGPRGGGGVQGGAGGLPGGRRGGGDAESLADNPVGFELPEVVDAPTIVDGGQDR
jgi:hypothetical protein